MPHASDDLFGDASCEFVTVNPMHRLLAHIGLAGPGKTILRRRVLFFAGITWLPLAIITLIQHTFYNPTIEIDFLEDIAVHVRLLLALPLLIIAETSVDPRLSSMIDYLEKSRVIPAASRPEFDKALTAAKRSCNSFSAEIIMLLGALAFGIVMGWMPPVDVASWYYNPVGKDTLFAGWYYFAVSSTVFAFIVVRWLRFMATWALLLRRIARLPLNLTPTHPDRNGGLAMIGTAQTTFASVFFALAVVVSGALADAILHEGIEFQIVKATAILFTVLSVLLITLPLAPFMPLLYRARWRGQVEYGALGDDLVTDFDEKWVAADKSPDKLLDSVEPSTLADYTAVYDTVRTMNVLPVSLMVLVRVAVTVLIPFMPLALTHMSLQDAMSTLLSVFM